MNDTQIIQNSLETLFLRNCFLIVKNGVVNGQIGS